MASEQAVRGREDGSPPADGARPEGQERPSRDAPGFLRRGLAFLRSLSPGARALKTALAVGLAWWLATLLGEPRPLFAALGALLGMEATVARSLRRTGLQLGGMLGGLFLAFLVSHFLGAGPIGISLAVLFGLWLGRRVGSPDRVGVELGVTTLLVVVLASGDPEWATDRVWETVLGGLVAATINALVLPPDYLGRLADDLHVLSREVTGGLRQAVYAFFEQHEHEGAGEALERLRAARDTLPEIEGHLDLARSALRFSPLLRGRAPIIARYGAALRLYTLAVHHVTTLARTVQEHAARPHTWPHTGLAAPVHVVAAADAISKALECYEEYAHTGNPAVLDTVRRELTSAEEALSAFLDVTQREQAEDTAVQRLVDIASVESELQHLAADLATMLDGLVPLEQAAEAVAAK